MLYSEISTYIPSRKGKAKVPRDLDAIKTSLQTPLLPDGINFEVSPLGQAATMKFKDWDLADSDKFPHLTMESLMTQKLGGSLITLELRKWLRSVQKAELLHLQWIPHFHHAPITIFFIR